MQDQQLRVSLEDLGRLSPQPKPAEGMHEVLLGIGRHLNNATLALKTIYDRLVAIEHQTKRPRSRGFGRYFLGICIGVAATLAWLPYGDEAKQIIATNASKLGWSPDTKRLIASWVGPENASARPSVPVTPQPATVAQTAPAAIAPKAPVAPSIDPDQVRQMALDLAALRHIVEQLATGQDQMGREITGLQTTNRQILEKITPAAPPPLPVAAPAHKPTPIGPPRSRAPIATYGPPPYGPLPYGPPPYEPPPYGPPYQ